MKKITTYTKLWYHIVNIVLPWPYYNHYLLQDQWFHTEFQLKMLRTKERGWEQCRNFNFCFKEVSNCLVLTKSKKRDWTMTFPVVEASTCIKLWFSQFMGSHFWKVNSVKLYLHWNISFSLRLTPPHSIHACSELRMSICGLLQGFLYFFPYSANPSIFFHWQSRFPVYPSRASKNTFPRRVQQQFQFPIGYYWAFCKSGECT